SSHATLSAASHDRKARLAQLKSLKRKQAPTDEDSADPSTTSTSLTTISTSTSLQTTSSDPSASLKPTDKYLSGRNFDPSTRSAKLGFESTPISDPTQTLEYKAQQLALQTKKEAEEAEKSEKEGGAGGIDLFKLQPKKPNWDLKRDLEEKLKIVDVWTENAIARLVRERVEGQKRKAVEAGGGSGEGKNGSGEGENVGMEGKELVEAMHLRERDEEE
ncbi:hypothetical protein GQ43DRAFT_339231, partial [Delitschia confertaspora ATCC 74209]